MALGYAAQLKAQRLSLLKSVHPLSSVAPSEGASSIGGNAVAHGPTVVEWFWKHVAGPANGKWDGETRSKVLWAPDSGAGAAVDKRDGNVCGMIAGEGLVGNED